MTMTATYSPEDNKLRLYSSQRLSSDEYARARSAGFIWAPKQELFVAPMWTPDREDFLIELCGEIGDEDTSLVERAEQRAERFEDYSDNRAADAQHAKQAVSAIADNIPLGQPILVGHHSEKRARKDAERIENGMRKAIKMWDQSQYWAARAKGALRHAKYKERPDVRARRIKKIEADKRRQERSKAEHESALRFWQGKFNLVNKTTGEKKPLEIIEANRATIARVLGNSVEFCRMGCAIREGGSGSWDRWSAWDVLQPDEERYRDCPSWTVQQCQDRAFELYPALIAHCDRWIAHYENRLAYERAMLAEDGGTVSDQVKPEKGGACRCWVRRGWCEIVKVNKVSVTVMDNWGNGGKDFPRTVPFDKLAEVISKAQFEAMKGGGKTEAEVLRDFYAEFEKQHMAELNAASPSRDYSALGQYDKETVRSAVRVKLGIELPTGGVVLPQTVQTPRPYTPPQRTEFDDMRDTLKAGVQVVSANQLFPTPPEIAKQVARLCGVIAGRRVLEPSAGTGNLIEAIAQNTGFDCFQLVAVEINPQLTQGLERMRGKWLYATEKTFDVRCADFLSCNGDLGQFDLIAMNPPFENGADIKHIQHARTFLKPGGRLVAICANGPRQREALQDQATDWIDLPEGSFKESGTMVNAAIVVIDAI